MIKAQQEADELAEEFDVPVIGVRVFINHFL